MVIAKILRWLGHIARIEKNIWAKGALTRENGVKRKRRGHPQRKWIDACKDNLHKLRVVNWREVAMKKGIKKFVEKLQATDI